jgi:hypothetical protein
VTQSGQRLGRAGVAHADQGGAPLFASLLSGPRAAVFRGIRPSAVWRLGSPESPNAVVSVGPTVRCDGDPADMHVPCTNPQMLPRFRATWTAMPHGRTRATDKLAANKIRHVLPLLSQPQAKETRVGLQASKCLRGYRRHVSGSGFCSHCTPARWGRRQGVCIRNSVLCSGGPIPQCDTNWTTSSALMANPQGGSSGGYITTAPAVRIPGFLTSSPVCPLLPPMPCRCPSSRLHCPRPAVGFNRDASGAARHSHLRRQVLPAHAPPGRCTPSHPAHTSRVAVDCCLAIVYAPQRSAPLRIPGMSGARGEKQSDMPRHGAGPPAGSATMGGTD